MAASWVTRSSQTGGHHAAPRLLRIVGVLLAASGASLVLSGCFAATSSYVDPQLPKVSYSDLSPRVDPRPLSLTVEFWTHEKPNPKGGELVYEKVRKVLLASHLFASVSSAPGERTDRLALVMQNVGDMAEAGRKGAITGLTWGLAGSTVTDGYLLTATYRPADVETPFRKEYRHALYSTVGIQKGPDGLERMSLTEAFDQVVEGLVLNLLQDLQRGGYL